MLEELRNMLSKEIKYGNNKTQHILIPSKIDSTPHIKTKQKKRCASSSIDNIYLSLYCTAQHV